jgi:dihydroorotate dehydrogenase (NAD+) catalytic subunit
MGLCNPGITEGIQEAREYLSRSGSGQGLIVSLFGTSPEEFSHLARCCDSLNSAFLELNLSCPNVFDEFGTPLAASASKVGEIIRAVKDSTDLPVIAKLSPNVTDILPIARAAETAGADALCLINTLGPGLAIDINTGRPVLSNRYGGLSGGCVKPVALRLVHLVSREVSLPVIGMGGVSTWEDAVEMIIAGASLVGIGTAVMDRGMEVFTEVNSGVAAFLEQRNYRGIKEIPLLEI